MRRRYRTRHGEKPPFEVFNEHAGRVTDICTKLGLKPISDYYEIISKVDEKMRDGISKEDLQQYLKESNFAQILLALRDMFQRNAI